MNLYGRTLPDLERAGGAWTAREVVQQPSVWQQVERQVAVDRGEAQTFLAPLLERPQRRIVLTGAGTSAFIGRCLAPALRRQSAGEVAAISTTDIVSGPSSTLVPNVPTLLVSFARSGNSPESVAAVELAERQLRECWHLIITCNPDGHLNQHARKLSRAHVVLLPEATHDRGFAMTSSFTGMYLAAALTLGLAHAQDPQALIAAAHAVLDGWQNRLDALVAQRFERVIYLGANELQGLAHEAALKMLELSDGRVVSLAESPLGFRHGPKTVLNAKTLVVMFMSNDPYTRRYDQDLLRELRAEGIAGRIVALSGQPAGHSDDFSLPVLSQVWDWELCLPYAVFAQSLALLQSLSLDIRPDNPNAAGAVSRVVKGVSIYPAAQTV